MDVEQLKRYKKNFRTTVILTTIIIMVLGFYSGAYAKKESLDFLSTLAGVMEYILENPLKLYPVDWFYPAMFGIIAGIADLYIYNDYIRRKNSMPDKEHGTSKFNDNLDKFRREFVYDPKICTKKKCIRQRIRHMIFFILSFFPYIKSKDDDDEEFMEEWDDEYMVEEEE